MVRHIAEHPGSDRFAAGIEDPRVKSVNGTVLLVVRPAGLEPAAGGFEGLASSFRYLPDLASGQPF